MEGSFNESDRIHKSNNKDVFILVIVVSVFIGICIYGIYKFVCNLESNVSDTSGDVIKDELLLNVSGKYNFLNYLREKVTDDIEVIRYYYLDEEELIKSDSTDGNESFDTYYILREETFVNGVKIGKTAILEVLDKKINEVKEEYQLNHETLSFKDTKTQDSYVLVRKSNNEFLIENGKCPPFVSSETIFDDVNFNIMYLVNNKGTVLKEFKFSDCWLSGIVVKEEQIEDRYSIKTDTSVYDYELDDFVIGYEPVIYPDGRYFDVHDNYFYWLDRLNNNTEYRYVIENGKLVEKKTKVYDIYNYGFMEVGCT